MSLGDVCTVTKGIYAIQRTRPGPFALVTTAAEMPTADSYQFEGEAVCIPLVSATGHGHASMKRVHYVHGQFAVSNLLVACQPKPESGLTARWLWLYLNHHKETLLVPLMKGTANVSLKPTQLATVPISIPSVAEQRRIVDLVDALDEATDCASVAAMNARSAGDGVRNEWFGAHSHGARLSDVVEVTNGRLRSPRNASGPHMTRYVRAANVQDGALILDEPMYMNFTPSEQARYALRDGDVLVTEGSGSKRSIGASCRWNGEIDGVVCFQNHLLRLRPLSDELQAGFIYQWAIWSYRTGRFADVATGTNILSLGVGRVQQMYFPQTHRTEQSAFVDLMESFELQEKAATRLSSSLERLRAALLADLLTGDRRLPDSYDRFLDRAA